MSDTLQMLWTKLFVEPGIPWGWIILGLAAQACFMGRFIVQWWASERAKASVVPKAFWWLSIVGSLGLLTYALRRSDPVIILGQLTGTLIYTRNLVLIRKAAA